MSTRQKTLIKVTVLFSVVALIFLLGTYGSQLVNLREFYTTRESFSRFLISLGSYSPIFFVLLQALQVVISPIPGELTGIVGGYIYGATLGFILSTLGLALG